MTLTTAAQVAVLIGRFQPFHNGHASLLATALAAAPQVVVVLGSSFHARSAKNPFTWEERAAMINATLAPAERERVSFIAVRDYYDDKRWASVVREKVRQRHPDATRVALVGYFKDASSEYLRRFPQWSLVTLDTAADIDATRIRRVLFEAQDLDVSLTVLDSLVPLAVRQYLKAWSALGDYLPLAAEHASIEAGKAAWRHAPYPPVFSTVDAVVRTAEHVLLIVRGAQPGKGLWALPGGFLEQRERVLQGAMRELVEETGIAVLPSTLEDALVGVQVFDHPDRSQRGRTITHAHYFDLKADHFPAVAGADDAAHAEWVPIANLAGMEALFFDDHFHILDHFLGLTGD